MACSDIHTTKYSGGHDILVKMIKNAGGDWQHFPSSRLRGLWTTIFTLAPPTLHTPVMTGQRRVDPFAVRYLTLWLCLGQIDPKKILFFPKILVNVIALDSNLLTLFT